MPRLLIVDALARGRGGRKTTLDVIGIGPRLVAGILEDAGASPDLLPLEEIFRDPWILGTYDVLLVSGMSIDKPGIRRLVKLWQRYSGGLSIAGGPVSLEYRELLGYGFDLIVYGEAESQLEALSRSITKATLPPTEELEKIRGLAYRRKGRIVFTGRPAYISRRLLDKVIPSTRAVKGYPNYRFARVYVEVVRGCSNFRRPTIRLADGRKCILCDLCRSGPLEARLRCPVGIPAGCGYCSVPEIYGPPRSRSARKIVAEVRGLIREGVSRITLSAPDILDYGRDLLVEPKPLTDPASPPPNLEALKTLFEELWSIPEIERGEVIISAENVKASLVNEESARLLGEYLAGTTIHIGVETGDPELAYALGRPSTIDDARRAVSILKRHGLRPYVYFIHGLPGQTRKSAELTARLIEELGRMGVEKVTVYRFTPLPGTAFEGMPPGSPAVEDPDSMLIVEAARRVNIAAKRRMIGARIEAIVSGLYRGKRVAYPLRHGPVILLEEKLDVGTRVLVEIDGVLNERMVHGRVIRISSPNPR